MIPFPVKHKSAWILAGATGLICFGWLDIDSFDLLAQASFGLIGIFGGIAVAAALVFLGKSKGLLENSIDDYTKIRELTHGGQNQMRRSMKDAANEVHENIVVILFSAFANYILLLIGNTNIPRFTDEKNHFWSTPLIYFLGSCLIISALFAVWDTLKTLGVSDELEAEIDNNSSH